MKNSLSEFPGKSELLQDRDCHVLLALSRGPGLGCDVSSHLVGVNILSITQALQTQPEQNRAQQSSPPPPPKHDPSPRLPLQ